MLDAFLLIALYFIVAYIMIFLYEQGFKIWVIRIILTIAFAYYYYGVNNGAPLSPSEANVALVITLAHLFTVSPNETDSSCGDSTNNSTRNASSKEVKEKRSSSSSNWLLSILFLGWLLDDDDYDSDDYF